MPVVALVAVANDGLRSGPDCDGSQAEPNFESTNRFHNFIKALQCIHYRPSPLVLNVGRVQCPHAVHPTMRHMTAFLSKSIQISQR
jgi:hypothetical protein